MFEALIIADSISTINNSSRVTTIQVTYPRFIHSEIMTYRVFSRNAASSRAIPTKKILEQVRNNPAMPIHWGKNQSGMQASEEINNKVEIDLSLIGLEGKLILSKEDAWAFGAKCSAMIAEGFLNAGYHKQLANRQLEHSQWMKTIITATTWDNMFEQRCHKDAQPEFEKLAYLIKDSLNQSIPSELKLGDWHLPYVNDDEKTKYELDTLVKLSTARCARVSYLNHDQSEPQVDKDIDLHDKLVVAKPIHASPSEHSCTPDIWNIKPYEFFSNPQLHGNLKGWVQYRKLVERNLLPSHLNDTLTFLNT